MLTFIVPSIAHSFISFRFYHWVVTQIRLLVYACFFIHPLISFYLLLLPLIVHPISSSFHTNHPISFYLLNQTHSINSTNIILIALILYKLIEHSSLCLVPRIYLIKLWCLLCMHIYLWNLLTNLILCIHLMYQVLCNKFCSSNITDQII